MLPLMVSFLATQLSLITLLFPPSPRSLHPFSDNRFVLPPCTASSQGPDHTPSSIRLHLTDNNYSFLCPLPPAVSTRSSHQAPPLQPLSPWQAQDLLRPHAPAAVFGTAAAGRGLSPSQQAAGTEQEVCVSVFYMPSTEDRQLAIKPTPRDLTLPPPHSLPLASRENAMSPLSSPHSPPLPAQPA